MLVLLWMALAVAASAEDLPPVVAIVNDHRITRQDLERRMAQSRSMDPERFDAMSAPAKTRALMRVLDACVVQEVEYQEALAQAVQAPHADVSEALEKVRRAFPDEEAFRRSLSAAEISADEWREEMKRSLMISRLEMKVAAGLPASEWRKQRPEWIEGLRNKYRTWVWLPGRQDARNGN